MLSACNVLALCFFATFWSWLSTLLLAFSFRLDSLAEPVAGKTSGWWFPRFKFDPEHADMWATARHDKQRINKASIKYLAAFQLPERRLKVLLDLTLTKQAGAGQAGRLYVKVISEGVIDGISQLLLIWSKVCAKHVALQQSPQAAPCSSRISLPKKQTFLYDLKDNEDILSYLELTCEKLWDSTGFRLIIYSLPLPSFPLCIGAPDNKR